MKNLENLFTILFIQIDKSFKSLFLKYLKKKKGFIIDFVDSIKEAKKILKLKNYKLIILENFNDDYKSSISLIRYARRIDKSFFSILLIERDILNLKIEEYYDYFNSILIKPVNIKKLYQLIFKYYLLFIQRELNYLDPQIIINLKSEIKIKNELKQVSGIARWCLYELENYISTSDYKRLFIAITETIFNAIEHGNLEISPEEKENAILKDKYSKLIEERLRNEIYKNRYIRVKKEITDDKKFIITIEDQGKGFDIENIKKFISSENLISEKFSGKGMLIIKKVFDSIEFYNNGRVIKLTKKIEGLNRII